MIQDKHGSFFFGGIVLLIVIQTGCAVVHQAYEPKANPAPAVPIMAEADPQPAVETSTSGSLWHPGLSGSLFCDNKAFHRGDIVLVNVVQNSSGSKKADVDTKRTNTISANIQYLLGLEKRINKLTGYTNNTGSSSASGTTGSSTPAAWNPNDLINAQSSREYVGQGSTDRTDTLQATVSAIVTEVLTNGNLVIYGHQTVRLNNEDSVLTVQGIVRTSDLASDNSVSSTRIANANIQFTGKGVLSDGQHPGWATRIFDWVWPF